MKPVFLIFASLLGLLSCGSKKEVDPVVSRTKVDVRFTKDKYRILQGNNSITTLVSASGDSAFITISAEGAEALGAIYVLYQKDSEQAVPWTLQPGGGAIAEQGYAGTSLYGTDRFAFDFQGQDYTFDIPDIINGRFKLTIPIQLRRHATAKSEIFTIWITKEGRAGRFDSPTYNMAFGLGSVTFNYVPNTSISNYITVIGGTKNPSLGALFSTKIGASYKRPYAQDTADIEAGSKHTDLVFNDVANKKYVFGSFYSTSTQINPELKYGFGDVSNITRVVKITETTADFDAIGDDASLLAAVTAAAPIESKVVFTADPTGKVLAFITADNKRGLLKIVSASDLSSSAAQLRLHIKVQR